MRVVWVALIAAGALTAAGQTSRAQYAGTYPPPWVPPAYTQQQVIPDKPPTVNLQPYNGSYVGPLVESAEGYAAGSAIDGCPPGYAGGGYASSGSTFYANERDVVTGWYLAGMVGAMYLEDQFSEAVNSNVLRQEDIAFDWNVTGGTAIGYRFPTRPHDLGQLRMEFDTMFNKNEVKTLVFNGGERNATGQVASNSFMYNMAVDFIHWGNVVTPYVGGGVGFMRVAEDVRYGMTTFEDEDFVFAFQGMAGISVQLCERIQWFTEWRYLGGSNPKFNRIGGPGPPTTVELRSEYNTHSIMSGLRVDLH